MRSRPYYPRKSAAISCLLLLALLAAPALVYGREDAGLPAAENTAKKIGRLDLENGFERYFFYTRYRIGGKTYSRSGGVHYHFPISELRFPLETFMFYANLNLSFIDRITIHFNVRKNIHNKVGIMKDTDWVPYPGVKTIYSESTARLNAIFTEADLSVRLFTVSFFSLVLGAGFTHQYFYYWCSDTLQTSIYTSTPPYIGSPSIIKIPCTVITYDLRYYMATIQITPVFTFIERLEIALALRFSPYLRARDIDDHILRGKKSKGDSDGRRIHALTQDTLPVPQQGLPGGAARLSHPQHEGAPDPVILPAGRGSGRDPGMVRADRNKAEERAALRGTRCGLFLRIVGAQAVRGPVRRGPTPSFWP